MEKKNKQSKIKKSLRIIHFLHRLIGSTTTKNKESTGNSSP